MSISHPEAPQPQVTGHILMVRPARFGANPLTAASNAFQQSAEAAAEEAIATAAQQEFDAFVALLRSKGVNVQVADDTPDPHTPDAVFPNNWVSFHADGRVVLYPMMAENRRLERRPDVVQEVTRTWPHTRVVDLSPLEAQGHFLEGTGSMVLDRTHRVAYACRSPRTTAEGFAAFCTAMGYEGLLFDAADAHGHAIYHANVMMAIGEQVAVICLDSLPRPAERQQVADRLQATGHTLVDISFEQMNSFAGNMLEVQGEGGKRFMVMSRRAFASLSPGQLAAIGTVAEPLVIPLDVIETYGGGSVRCMMAEVFSPK